MNNENMNTQANSTSVPHSSLNKSKMGRNPFSVKKPKKLATIGEIDSTLSTPKARKKLNIKMKIKNSEHLISYAFTQIPYNTLERLAWGACFTYAVWNTFLGKNTKN